MIGINEATEVARGISEQGFLVMTAAFFLVLSAMMMVACFKWFKSIITKSMEDYGESLKELIEKTNDQNTMLSDISEGLKKAVAYLAYSRVVKFGNSLPTRFGTMNNNNAYSSHTELKERQMIADDTYSIGLKYVEEVLYYINDSEECEKPISKRSIFKIIGD